MTVLDTLRSVIRFEKLETDAVERRLARATSVADLRRIARRRLPGGVFDYIDAALQDADPLDKAAAYKELGIELRFHPEGAVRVEARPRLYPSECRRGDLNPHALNGH